MRAFVYVCVCVCVCVCVYVCARAHTHNWLLITASENRATLLSKMNKERKQAARPDTEVSLLCTRRTSVTLWWTLRARARFNRTLKIQILASSCPLPRRGVNNTFRIAERGSRSANSTFVVSESTAKLKPVSKRASFRWRETTLLLLIALIWCSNWRKYDG